MVKFLPQVLVCLVTLLLEPVVSLSVIAAEPPAHRYSLDTIIEHALARNPTVSLAEGHIDYSRGQQVAAGAYPNPTVMGNTGVGEIRDTGRTDIQKSLTRQSVTEYNMIVGQPLEWPSMRAARQPSTP